MGLGGRIILHIDMDAFFASIEMREHPQYQDKPIIIGADPKEGKGRGVVATCNYKAREYGIHSAMPISNAYKRCPNAVFLPLNMPLYKRVSEDVMNILRASADSFEQVSIDEAFLDISTQALDYEEALKLAKKLKKDIASQEHLTCSIGIGPNKTVAKMASDFQKPQGITVVEQDKVKEFLYPLPAKDLPGIGPKTEDALRAFGIMTIGQLAKVPEKDLTKEFGSWGTRLHYLANGIDESEVKEEQGIQTVQRYHTFEEDLGDLQAIMDVLDNLCQESWKSCQKDRLEPRTVGVKIRFDDFETHTKEKTRKYPFKNAQEMKETARELLTAFTKSRKNIRLVGIRFSNLEPADTGQRTVEEYFK